MDMVDTKSAMPSRPLVLAGFAALLGALSSNAFASEASAASMDPAAMGAARKAGVTVLAHVVAKPGMESQVRDIFLSIVGPARTENGNLSYDLVESIDDPATFVSIETWKSADILQAHLSSQGIKDVIAKIAPLLAAPPSIVAFKMLSDPA
jgi:quinol monooxygenase YgiN